MYSDGTVVSANDPSYLNISMAEKSKQPPNEPKPFFSSYLIVGFGVLLVGKI